jgi:hypothetical protein
MNETVSTHSSVLYLSTRIEMYVNILKDIFLGTCRLHKWIISSRIRKASAWSSGSGIDTCDERQFFSWKEYFARQRENSEAEHFVSHEVTMCDVTPGSKKSCIPCLSNVALVLL